MLSFEEIRKQFDESLVGINAYRAMVKEYLQCLTLSLIYQGSYKNNLVFIGGTKLRLVDQFKRFSEDLDFDILGQYDDADHLDLCESLVHGFKKMNIQAELDRDKKIRKQGAYSRYINFPGILDRIGLEDVPNRKFFIKLDAEKHQFGSFSYKPKTQEFSKGMYQAHCIIANEAYDRKDKKRTPLILLNNILGGPGLNTRLNMGIREKYGFCYNIESNYTMYSDTGIVSIYLGTDFDYLEKTIKLAHKELKKLRDKKLGELQLQRAKQQMIGQIAISQESNVNELLSIGKSILAYDKVDSIEQIIREINEVTSEQLHEISNEVFDPKQLSLLIYKGQNN